MKQTHEYSSLARLAVIQHLRSYGIKIKNWNCKQRQEAGKGSSGGLQSVKVFGTPLHALPNLYVPDYGNIPGLLVDVCRYLETHIHTEGLFRKSGSVVRQKLLKAKLDSGDNSLSDAPPYDVAGILKQFFRELPDPILHADLQDAFYKAQHLSTEAERTAATMLVSCLIPDKTIHILRYFFRFLHTVSLRSDANKMDSSNLAVIFAPNLLHSNDDCEKISASTEKKLRVQALVVQTLIDQAANIGCVPDFLLEKIPGMLGIEGDAGTPVPEASEEGDGNSPGERKRRRRRSVGDFVSGALNKLKTNRTPTSTPVTDRTVLGAMVTPLILTPSTKRKLPADSVQGISNKKRKSIKHNLTFDLLPNSLFGSGSTPSSDRYEESPPSQSSLSPSVSGSKHLTSSGNLRRSKRCENRRVQRVESGKTGCFSPKISRKEMVRRSLRLRFSLGKSSKDVNSNGCPSSIRSQNIGWRLANSQELNPLPGNDKMETTPFSTKSPFVSAGSKRISKSEENLLTPKLSEGSDHRISWTGSHPLELDGMCNEGTPVAGYLCATNYYSEPVLVAGKPPAMPKNLSSRTGSYNPDQELKDDSLCEEQQNWAQNTLMRITRAFTESGSDLCMVAGVGNRLEDLPEAATISEPQTEMPHSILKHSDREKQLEGTGEYTSILKETFSARKLETAMEAETARTTYSNSVESSVTCVQTEALLIVEEKTDIPVSVAEVNCSKQEYGKENTLGICELPCESTPYPAVQESVSSEMRLIVPSPSKGTILPVPGQEMTLDMPVCKPHHPSPAVRRISRVSDHIQHFNKLCLTDRNSVKLKSPIKFERTPVRQSVRRINSLSDVKRQVNSTGLKSGTVGSTLVKSISYDGCMSSKLSLVHSNPSKHDPETNVSQEKLSATSLPEASTRIDRMFLRKSACSPAPAVNPVKSALEDLTNQGIQRITCKKPIISANKPYNTVHSVSGSERNRYKGSPKNPISRVTFLPSSKPLDL